MAAPDIEPHQPPSKTPRQLVIVVVLAFAVPIVLVLLLANLATTGMRAGAGSANSEAVAERIRPVAQVNIGQPAGEAKAEKTGEQVVQSTCGACHQTGAAGAPRIGDKAAWGPRIAKGEKALLQSALHGLRAMPAKGGNPDLSDTEVERALVFMANQAGAHFNEPAPSRGTATATAAAAPAASPAPAAPAVSASPAQPTAAAKGGKTGEQVVQGTCGACHQTGAAGAPKIGDKSAWGPRIAKGEKSLLQSALKGLNAMPPKGGNADLSDVEVERALVYMANQAGAGFKEPGAGGKAAK